MTDWRNTPYPMTPTGSKASTQPCVRSPESGSSTSAVARGARAMFWVFSATDAAAAVVFAR